MPPVESISIGGSEATGKADTYSDLDFFITIPGVNFFSNVHQVGEIIATSSQCLHHRYEGFVQTFGFTYTFLDTSGVWVDLFINCPETLSSTPMMKKNKILYDTTGIYSNHLITTNSQRCLSENNAITDLLVELDMMRKYAARRELIPLIHHIDQLRITTMAIDRMRILGHPYCPYSPYGADCRAREDLGIFYEQKLINTIPSPDPLDVNKAVILLARMALESLANVGHLDTKSVEIADAMLDDISSNLTVWAHG